MVKNKEKIILIALTVFCVLAVGGLGATLGVLEHKTTEYERDINTVYDRAYYASADCLGDIENKLYKLRLTTSSDGQRKILNELHSDCEVLAVHLSALQNENGQISEAIAFVNKLGGYSAYLAGKLPAEPLTEEEKSKFLALLPACEGLHEEFCKAGAAVALGGAFRDSLGKASDVLGGVYGAFDSGTVEYPEMIYDGPFSDGLDTRNPVYLAALEEVSVEQARQTANGVFGCNTYVGDYDGVFEGYVFGGENGKTVTITKRGGMVAEFVSATESTDGNVDKKTLTSNAVALLNRLGYANMQGVWVSVNGDTAYVNCAYVQDGVIYYPDLIKVKLDTSDGSVIGLEAENYLFNHAPRTLVEGIKSSTDVVTPEGFTSKSLRLALIPTDGGGEILCYEAYGSYEGSDYYLYYDALTLAEVKVMRVVNDDMRGELIV